MAMEPVSSLADMHVVVEKDRSTSLRSEPGGPDVLGQYQIISTDVSMLEFAARSGGLGQHMGVDIVTDLILGRMGIEKG